jgi:predicted SAM-dependent methyltransferase
MMSGDELDQKYCILCENAVDGFIVDPNINKPKFCPRCNSSNRTRMTYYHLKKNGFLQRSGLKVLHVAPHVSIESKLREIFGEGYMTCDLVRNGVDLRLDLTAMTFKDNAFDLIIMNHVLEHIHEDKKALNELNRILAVNGCLHLMVQINRSSRITRYHPADLAKPLSEFGPQDHIRLYAWDIVKKLEKCGFATQVVEYSKLLSKEQLDYHGFKRDVILWCQKR